jgi:presequence protease
MLHNQSRIVILTSQTVRNIFEGLRKLREGAKRPWQEIPVVFSHDFLAKEDGRTLSISEEIPMTIIEGFERLRVQDIHELRTQAQLFRHVKTGAELLSLTNDDDNKVFGITFRTPPKDSTGVAHILEHSVLCGSRKYPVKEPFVELLKGSLKTFLNAFTYPDKTCYPVASQNVQDFYNLIDVYLDAVFYPRITPFIFQQEGWHLELDAVDGELIYKGVVFNEMKGAYSSPDSVLFEHSQQALFPDNTYGLDSGGNPKRIIELTFEQFKAFHRQYYHPSNARLYFYGNDDPARRLQLVKEYLNAFERIPVDSSITLQPSFDHPRRIAKPYASADHQEGGDRSGRRGMLTVNWLLGETTNAQLNFALHVLQYILLGMPGSPLRKALIDSGLGDDVAGVGLEGELRQMYFSTGLKGIDPEAADQVEELILKTLEKLATQGIDRQTTEAALNTIEFRLRENNSGSFPRGLNLMLRALTTWLYDADPLSLLAFEAPLQGLKTQLAANPRFYEELIDRFFLNNPHRATLILEPDPDLANREEAAEREQLKAVRQSLPPAQLQEVIANTRELRRLQEVPDPPEALQTIPTLRVEDLDRSNKLIPQVLLRKEGDTTFYHDLFTNGIVYLDAGFNLRALKQQHLPYVPLFGRALVEIGTTKEDFVALTQRISQKTGGIRPDIFTSASKLDDKGALWLLLRGKSMLPQLDEFLALLREVLLTVRLDNRERFRQMVLEEKARQEEKLVPGGHQIVNLRLRSHFSEADWVAEQMSGVSYLFFLRDLARKVEDDWREVLAVLEDLRQTLIKRDNMILNVTLDQDSWSFAEAKVAELLQAFPSGPTPRHTWSPEYSPRFEGLTIPAQVNYVGKGANLYQLGYQGHGSAQVISGYLRTSWLWERIRVQGGAYGAFCMFDRISGTMTFVSYRDPNLLQTIDNFNRSVEFLRNVDLNDNELTKAIIGAIGHMDTYLLPDAKGYVAMLRHLTGDTETDRQRLREEILATTAADFRAFAEVLERLKTEGIVKVLGAESALDEALAAHPGWLNLLKVL